MSEGVCCADLPGLDDSTSAWCVNTVSEKEDTTGWGTACLVSCFRVQWAPSLARNIELRLDAGSRASTANMSVNYVRISTPSPALCLTLSRSRSTDRTFLSKDAIAPSKFVTTHDATTATAVVTVAYDHPAVICLDTV
eukprot:PhM_4_TR8470/c4_g1_i1/m.104104